MTPGELVTALVRACEARDLDRVCSLVTDDIEYDNVPMGKVYGPDGVR
jgi:limonene-1,2-epoxide hydrolase